MGNETPMTDYMIQGNPLVCGQTYTFHHLTPNAIHPLVGRTQRWSSNNCKVYDTQPFPETHTIRVMAIALYPALLPAEQLTLGSYVTRSGTLTYTHEGPESLIWGRINQTISSQDAESQIPSLLRQISQEDPSIIIGLELESWIYMMAPMKHESIHTLMQATGSWGDSVLNKIKQYGRSVLFDGIRKPLANIFIGRTLICLTRMAQACGELEALSDQKWGLHPDKTPPHGHDPPYRTYSLSLIHI